MTMLDTASATYGVCAVLSDGSSALAAPKRDGLVTDLDAPLGKQLFDIAVAEREAVVQADRVADDLGRKTVAAEGRRRRGTGADPTRCDASTCQCLHELPMASGYVARLPSSAWAMLQVQRRLADRHDYRAVCRDYDFRYLVVLHSNTPIGTLADAHLVFADDVAGADAYDLAPICD